jgi:integrase
VNHLHFLIQAAIEKAKDEGLINRNGVDKIILPKMEKKEADYLRPDEVDRFLNVAEGDRLFPALYMELGTGLRRGELLGLMWSDIDFQAGTAMPRRQLVLLRGRPKLKDGTKNTRRTTRAPLPKDVIEVLRFHKRRQDAEKEFCGQAYEDSGLVFYQPNGRRISTRSFVRHFDLLLKSADITHIALHGTGHVHAVELLAAGVDMKALQEQRLGHADLRTTGNIYGHVGEMLQEDAAEKADMFLNRRKHKTAAAPKTKTSRKRKTG